MPSFVATPTPRSPRRVLFVITDLDIGGAEKCCAELATRLDRRRWQPEVCSLVPPGRMAERLIEAGVPVHSVGVSGPLAAPLAVLRLARLMRRLRPAIVHTILFHANVIGRLAARLASVPRVVSSIRVAERRFRYHLAIENLTCRLSDRVVCVSDAVTRFTARQSHVPFSRLVTIPNGVEITAAGATPPTRQRLVPSLLDDAVIALYVGRLDPQKGVDVLIDAIARVRRDAPSLHVAIAGAGPQRAELEALAARLGVADRTHWLGWRDDVPALLRSADLFVLPSRWEGMPNVVLEAMAAARPVIATRTEGTSELVQHGVSGRLVAIDSPAELASALGELAADIDLRERLGRAGQERVRCHFSLDAMFARHVAIYEDLLRAN